MLEAMSAWDRQEPKPSALATSGTKTMEIRCHREHKKSSALTSLQAGTMLGFAWGCFVVLLGLCWGCVGDLEGFWWYGSQVEAVASKAVSLGFQ